MNDVDFPVVARARGDRGGAGGRACRSRSTASSSAASTSTRSSSSRATSAAPASRSASSSSWTSARRTAGGWTTSSRPPRSSRMLDKEFGVEPVDAQYRGEVAKRWRYKDGARRDRRHRVGHAAVLRRLHPLAALGRGQALHLPLRRARPRPARADPRAARPTRSSPTGWREIWRVRGDRYSELRAENTVDPAIGERKVEMSLHRRLAAPRRDPVERSRFPELAAVTSGFSSTYASPEGRRGK